MHSWATVCCIIDTVYFPKGLETETRAQIYPCLELRHHADITNKAKETKQAKCDYLVYLSERSTPIRCSVKGISIS